MGVELGSRTGADEGENELSGRHSSAAEDRAQRAARQVADAVLDGGLLELTQGFVAMPEPQGAHGAQEFERFRDVLRERSGEALPGPPVGVCGGRCGSLPQSLGAPKIPSADAHVVVDHLPGWQAASSVGAIELEEVDAPVEAESRLLGHLAVAQPGRPTQ
ncbi:hypothetical protein AB0G51_20515 [Streptomyces asoensis]|uniref:hypothetical protein n=1 Tax=Streptomyces asoensis TaxID=249586 RepID=UPI0033D0700B